MPNATQLPAKARLAQLRDAALPFVARTFRGNRLRRYAAASALLGLLSVLVGVWLSFGTGEFERDMRRAMDLEENRWDQDRISFRITADSALEFEMLEDDLDRLDRAGSVDEYSQLGSVRERAYSTLYTALSVDPPALFQSQQDQIRALLAEHPPSSQIDDPQWHYSENLRDYQFDWYQPSERARLQAIIDRELTPAVTLYASPLDATDGVRVTGAVAGGLVVLLMLIVAPLSSGATLAQEVHENTLQPVLGTRLRPADIIAGLTLSGLALGGLLAAPSLLVTLVAGLAAGTQIQLLPFVLLLPAASVFTVLLTQLVGFGLGRRWSSGIVATLLTAGLCMAMLFSVGFGMNLEDEMIGLVAMMPPVGLVHALRELFVPGLRLGPADVAAAMQVSVLAVVGFGALAGIMGRALTRRIEGRTQASLTRVEGFVAAALTLVLALVVIPDFNDTHAVAAYFVSLGLVALPWMLVLGGRVPVGDGPAKLRTIPLRSIMLELAGYVAIHTTVLVAIFGFDHVPWTAAGAFHLLWALAVMGLVAVRMVALPTNIVGSLFVMLSLAAVCFEFVSAGIFASAADHTLYAQGPVSPFVLFEASAVLGVIQLVLTVSIPVALVRALRKGSAGLV